MEVFLSLAVSDILVNYSSEYFIPLIPQQLPSTNSEVCGIMTIPCSTSLSLYPTGHCSQHFCKITSLNAYNGVWVGFSRGSSRFPLPQISFHHFSTLISSISFHFISPCDGATGVVGRHPCFSRTYNIGASSHLILDPTLCWTRVEDIYI